MKNERVMEARIMGQSAVWTLLFEGSELPRTVDTPLGTRTVFPFVYGPIRCYKCLKIGHKARDCKVEKPICGRCGQDTHPIGECQREPKCLKCNGPHNVMDRECPRNEIAASLRHRTIQERVIAQKEDSKKEIKEAIQASTEETKKLQEDSKKDMKETMESLMEQERTKMREENKVMMEEMMRTLTRTMIETMKELLATNHRDAGIEADTQDMDTQTEPTTADAETQTEEEDTATKKPATSPDITQPAKKQKVERDLEEESEEEQEMEEEQTEKEKLGDKKDKWMKNPDFLDIVEDCKRHLEVLKGRKDKHIILKKPQDIITNVRNELFTAENSIFNSDNLAHKRTFNVPDKESITSFEFIHLAIQRAWNTTKYTKQAAITRDDVIESLQCLD